jgi:hypothetical protein
MKSGNRGNMENPEAAAEQILKNAGLNIKSAEKGTDALFFMSYCTGKSLGKISNRRSGNNKGQTIKRSKTKST